MWIFSLKETQQEDERRAMNSYSADHVDQEDQNLTAMTEKLWGRGRIATGIMRISMKRAVGV